MRCPFLLPARRAIGVLGMSATAARHAGRLAGLALCAVLAASPAAAEQGATALADFSSGPPSGLYAYTSSTPHTLVDLIDTRRPREATTVTGRLLLPAGEARVPAVVLVHGSGGVYAEQTSFWARRFAAQGIASLVIDVFGPRGVEATAEDQSQVPFAADVADTFAALRVLASHPRIDATRIAVIGFSRGGVSAWRSALLKVAQAQAPVGVRFAAHVAMYSGGCNGSLAVLPGPGVFGPAPILFVHGEDDDYTSAADCRDFAQRIADAGTPTRFVGLPGARHKFDLDNPRRVTLQRVSRVRAGCPLAYDIDARVLRDRRSGAALSGEALQTVQRELCSATGASVEGDSRARDAAAQAVDTLFSSVFAR